MSRKIIGTIIEFMGIFLLALSIGFIIIGDPTVATLSVLSALVSLSLIFLGIVYRQHKEFILDEVKDEQ